MIQVRCPRCRSKLEITEFKGKGSEGKDAHRVAVHCVKEDCLYHKNPLIGLDRLTSEVFVSEALI